MNPSRRLARVFAETEEENRRTILRLLPERPDGTLLDIGAHEGEFTERVAAAVRPARTIAVELLPQHAERCRARGIETVEANVEEGLPFDDASFAVVHANQVIEHLRSTDTLLREIRRVLAPGGVACISTNNLSSWHNVLSLALGLQPPPAHVSDELIVGNPLNPERGATHADIGRTHLRIFTIRALRELCEHHGLHPLEVRSVGYYPFPPRLARLAVRIDPLHGAFVTALFAPR